MPGAAPRCGQPRPISLLTLGYLSGTSRVPLGPRWGRPYESGLSFTSRIGRACCGLADTVDPTAQMKHARNAELRVHSAVMETSLEIVFTWTGVVLVLWYNVSADGRAVDTATVVANGVVQHAIEMLVDLVIILHLTVLQGEPYLEVTLTQTLTLTPTPTLTPTLILTLTLTLTL